VLGTDAAPAASGQVVFIRDEQKAVLVVLRPLPPDRTYQIWLIRDSVPISGGLFQVSPTGEASAVVAADLRQFQLIAVTEEPDGVSPKPAAPSS